MSGVRVWLGRVSRRPIPGVLAAALLAAVAVVADPYPPYWSGGAGTAIHYAPVAWPAGGSATTNWTPYTRIGVDIADKRDTDTSNGGTSPQSYVNVSSGCTDVTEPSVYYAYDPANQVLFFRWRVQAPPHTYATGPNPGTYSSSSPWSSALWTVFMDTNGDGYRDFAVHLDGSSGSPSASVDRLVSIWSTSKNQSLDYVNDSSIHLLHHNPAAFVDGPSATDRILNFHNALSPDSSWPNGSSETTWDYGTTRASALGTSCGEYFIDYQIPLSMLDASAVGGPSITSTTPMSLFFATANSLQNPIQKDAVVAGDFVADPYKTVPGGDTITPAGGTIQQPTVTSVTATGCGPTALTAYVFDTLNVDRTSTVSSVAFYDYADTNANGSEDDGSTWTLAANGTAASDPINKWTASWNSSALQSGKYLIAVKATDSSGNVTWSQYSTQAAVNTFTGSAASNYPNATGAVTTSLVNSCGTSAPSISKTVSPSYVAAGGTVTFTVSIANTLGSAMTVSSITDSMPSGFTYQSTSGSGTIGSPSTSPSTNASGNITWTFAPVSIPAGATRTLIFTAKAGSTAGTYTNSVSASTSSGTLSSSATDVGVGSPSLTITKTASVTSANPGDSVAYTITYANDSPVNVTNAVITDVLPTGLTFVSATGGGTYNSGTRTVTWNIGSLASGSGASSVVLNASIDNPYSSSAAIPVVNTASIASTESSSSSSSASVYVNAPRAQLAIQIDGSASQVSAGSNVTFTLTYSNTGAGSASGVALSEAVPAGWSFVSATGGGTNSSGTVSWTIGSLASATSGTVQLTLQAGSPNTGANPATHTATISGTGLTSASDSYKVAVTQTAQVCSTYYFRSSTTNVGAVSGSFGGTRQIANTTAVTSSDTGTTIGPISSTGSANEVELTTFYQDPVQNNQVNFNGNISTTMYLSKGNGAQPTVTGYVYDYNPSTGATTLLGSGSSSFSGNANTIQSFQFTVALNGTLTPGHRILWRYTIKSSQTNNSTDATLYYGGAVSGMLRDSNSNFCVTAPANPTLDTQVDKLVASAGNSLTYTIRFGNAGQTNMTGAQIANTLPDGVTFSSATLNGTAVSAATTSGQTRTFNVNSSDTATSGQVTGGQSGTLVINATISQPFTGASDTLTDSSTLTSTQTSSLSDSMVTVLQRPSVTISKTADKTLLVPGDTVTYTLTALNSGPGAASSVTVGDALPATAYFTYVAGSAKLNGSTISPDPVSGSTLSKNIGSLAAGAAATLSFQMTVAASGVPSGTTTVSNTATVSDAATSGSRNSNASSLTISTNPNLTITKASSPASGPVAAGSTITYTLTVSNTGSGDATGVAVRDLIPASTSYTAGTLKYAGVSQTDASGDDNSYYDASGNRVMFSIGTLSAGGSKTLSYDVTVGSPLSNGTTTISSTATATASNAASKTATASITASAAPVLSLTKSAPSNVAYPLTTLAAGASAATTIAVASAASISIGDVISVGGTTATVTAVSGTAVTLGSAVTASNGTQVLPTWEYRLAYANSGTAAASSVVVTDALPAGLTFISADNGGTNSSGTVTWNLGSVASGSSGTLRVRVRPGSATTYSNSASLASAELSTVASNSTSTTTGALTVAKSTSTPSTSTSGNTTSATYVITLVNQSPSAAASGVTVQDDLPSGFTYLSTTSVSGATASSSPSAGDTSPTWSGLSVPANSTATITFTAKVSNVAPGTYQNYVTVTSSNASVVGFDALSTTAEDVTVSATLGTTGVPAITATIAPGGTETLSVTDADLNANPAAAETVQVTVRNTRTGELETVTLTETGANTGVFSGTLATNASSSAGSNNSAPLNVASGDTVRLSYSDALTSTGGAATVTADGAVSSANTAPVAVADSYSVNEDATLTVAASGVLGNDSDADGNALTAVKVTDPAHGTLTLNGNGSFTYTPAANYNGSDSFTYKANDGSADSNTVAVSITVNAVNDAPVAVADSYSVNEDATLTVAASGVLANDTDVDGNSLTAIKVTDPSHGTLTLNSNGSFTYTPAANYNGSDSFTYKANDGTADSNTVTVSITVNAVNDAPVATADSYSVNEDATLTVAASGVLGNDTDVDGNSLSAILVSDVTHGTLTLSSNGSFTYTPAANYNGSDSFTYKANDGTADSNTVTVAITVNAVNDAPVATADSYSVSQGGTLTVAAAGVLANDSDVDGDSLTAVKVTDPAHGTLTLNANGSFTYSPSAGYSGADSFTYKANDGTADSNTVTVSITVNAVNTAPVAVADSYSVNEDATLTVAASGVLANDSDADGNTLSAALVADVSHGTLTLNGNGSFTYTPAANYNGADGFTYRANDGAANSNTVTVSITVNPVNDAPVAVADSYSVNEDATLTVAASGVLGNDTDVDGNSLTAVKVTDPAHGTLTLNANGSFTYTPSANYNGSDSFTYKANDGTADSNTVTVTITVTPINDPPAVTMTAAALGYTEGAGAVTVDTALTVSDVDSATLVRATMAIAANYVSGDDVLAFTSQNGISGTFDAATGVLTLTGAATPAQYQLALRSVTYRNVAAHPSTATRTVSIAANDGQFDSTAAVRQIVVQQLSQPTLTQPADVTVDEDSGAATISLTQIGAGASGGTVSVSAQPADASLFTAFAVDYADPDATGRIRFTPAPDAFGSTQVSVTVTAMSSGIARTTTRVFTLTVVSVNDAPTLNALADRSGSVAKALTVSLAGIGTGAANENQPLTVTAVSSDPSIVRAPIVSYAPGASTGTLTLTPSATGTAVITVTVDDGQTSNHVVTRAFTVTVARNTPPTITPIADLSVVEGNPLPAVTFTVGDAETAASGLTVTYRTLNDTLVPASGITMSGGDAARGLALASAANKVGTARIVVTVSDGELSASTAFNAIVRPQWDYYLSDGSASTLSATDVRATNPHGADAPVRLTFLKPDDAPASQSFNIAAGTRWSARLSGLPGAGTGDAATFIRSVDNLPLLVERTMTWDGDAHAGSAETALESTNLQWYFAEGGQSGLRTNLIVANPNDAEVTVTVTFMLESGAVAQRGYTVGGMRRRTIAFSDVTELRGANFGMVVDASLPIAAERTTYLDSPRERQAGSTAAGVPYPSQQWYFAEGSDWKIFQTYVLLLNPGEAAASVRVEYHTMFGLHFATTHTVAAHSRLTVDTLKAEPLLDGQHFWMSVTADQPIVAERSMYWDRGMPSISESHGSHGVIEPSQHWATGDARVGGAQRYSTFVLVANPTPFTATATMRIKRDNGQEIVSTRQIAPLTRDTINVKAAVPDLNDESFWITVDSDMPVFVERSQYWNPEGTRGSWSAGTNTFAVPVVPVDYNGCAYSINPRQLSAPAQGGMLKINVGATSRCTFVTEPAAAWVRAVSGASGSGVSTVVLRVAANPTALARTTSVTIAGQTIPVAQDAGPAAGGDPQMALDAPVDGARVGSVFRVSGWAVDLAALDGGTGVSTVHVWAYPNPGSNDAPIFLGAAAYGGSRPDVEAILGEGTRASGFELTVSGQLQPGVYQLVAFARSTATGTFNQVRTATITVRPDTRIVIDAPAAGPITVPTTVTGWAVDTAAQGTSGIDAVQAWAMPKDGSASIFIATASYGSARPEVAVALGNAAFVSSGFSIPVGWLAPGAYRLVVSARRTGSSTFDTLAYVDIDVQSALAHDVVALPKIGGTPR